ncbi:hypothetical protein K491DRAFT_673945 [Lophiostoma macrostomum CBS 122681]|uniref:Uncharacterized protein n=1 Tax=Lophiostoma macrostomum CBS 122681 TaxID=1314788 RepID=A0A6A6TPM7_9PLEO|nr:hypothetical protein K491DRAFT_673945 [Lophiostoma macrostomum CBS 122681]
MPAAAPQRAHLATAHGFACAVSCLQVPRCSSKRPGVQLSSVPFIVSAVRSSRASRVHARHVGLLLPRHSHVSETLTPRGEHAFSLEPATLRQAFGTTQRCPSDDPAAVNHHRGS